MDHVNIATVAILSFYSFIEIKDTEILLSKILLFGKKKLLRGTILIAPEGINGSISGKYENAHLLLNEIKKLIAASDINIKINYSDQHPFQKLKVKIKPEIISMNIEQLNVNWLKGKYIDPIEWDEFICRDDVITIDTRNDYEVAVGAFKGAIDPKTETFKQFPEWVHDNIELLSGKKIAMYCTGGIRCEKSTSYLKHVGFTEVYHLRGGILQYLEDTKNKNHLWQGECFVFDDRRMVACDLSPSEAHLAARAK